MTDNGNGMLMYDHQIGGRASMQQNFKKYVKKTRHIYDIKIGAIVGGSGSYFKSIEIVDLDPSRFEVPADYKDILSDQELDNPLFQYAGRADMVEGTDLEPIMNFVIQTPDPPEPAQWIRVEEQWWEKGDGDARKRISILREVPLTGFDPRQLPIQIDHRITVEKWDAKAEVGDFSTRDDDGRLIFFGNGQLFQLSVPREYFGDIDLEIARKLLQQVPKPPKT